MKIKTCNICNESKTFEEFYKQNKKRGNGEQYFYYYPYCKECSIKKSYQWSLDNPERRKELKNAHNKRPKPKEDKRKWNTKRLKNGSYRKWQQENKDRIKQYNTNRQNKNHDITEEEWELCKKFFKYSCAYCSVTETEAKELYGQRLHKEHVEHNGANDITNCIPACKKCNSEKWEYELDEWYNETNVNYSSRRYNRIIKWLLSFTENNQQIIE